MDFCEGRYPWIFFDLVKVSVCAINFFWACINYAINPCIMTNNDLNVYKISINDFFDLIHEQDWLLNKFGTALNNEDFIFHFINCLAFGAENTAENEDDVHQKIFALLESYIREVTIVVM